MAEMVDVYRCDECGLEYEDDIPARCSGRGATAAEDCGGDRFTFVDEQASTLIAEQAREPKVRSHEEIVNETLRLVREGHDDYYVRSKVLNPTGPTAAEEDATEEEIVSLAEELRRHLVDTEHARRRLRESYDRWPRVPVLRDDLGAVLGVDRG